MSISSGQPPLPIIPPLRGCADDDSRRVCHSSCPPWKTRGVLNPDLKNETENQITFLLIKAELKQCAISPRSAPLPPPPSGGVSIAMHPLHRRRRRRRRRRSCSGSSSNPPACPKPTLGGRRSKNNQPLFAVLIYIWERHFVLATNGFLSRSCRDAKRS